MNWVGWAVMIAAGAAGTALVNVLVREVEGWVDLLPNLVLRLVCLRVPRSRRRDAYRIWAGELRDALAERDSRPISRLLCAVRVCVTCLRTPVPAAARVGEVRSEAQSTVSAEPTGLVNTRLAALPGAAPARDDRADLCIVRCSTAVNLSDAIAVLSSVKHMVAACAAPAIPANRTALNVRLGATRAG